MLVLFETSAGLALFKVKDEGRLQKLTSDPTALCDASSVAKALELKDMVLFSDMTDALSEATAIVEGVCGNIMKTFLQKSVVGSAAGEKLLMADKVSGVQCIWRVIYFVKGR